MTWLQVVPVAALVSAAVTLLIRWFDKPRARLYVEHKLQPGEIAKTVPNWFRVELRNIGDGAAHDIRVFGSCCDPAIRTPRSNADDAPSWTHQLGTLNAGESIRIEASMRPEDRNQAALIISWTPAPGRTWRRTMRVQLIDADAEFLFPPGVFEPVQIPPRVRRLRTLERLSPRAAVRRYSSLEDDECRQPTE